jgi:hypothetical protein
VLLVLVEPEWMVTLAWLVALPLLLVVLEWTV